MVLKCDLENEGAGGTLAPVRLHTDAYCSSLNPHIDKILLFDRSRGSLGCISIKFHHKALFPRSATNASRKAFEYLLHCSKQVSKPAYHTVSVEMQNWNRQVDIPRHHNMGPRSAYHHRIPPKVSLHNSFSKHCRKLTAYEPSAILPSGFICFRACTLALSDPRMYWKLLKCCGSTCWATCLIGTLYW